VWHLRLATGSRDLMTLSGMLCQNEGLPAEKQMITALPDVKTIALDERDKFMVVACDGIWNVLSSQEVRCQWGGLKTPGMVLTGLSVWNPGCGLRARAVGGANGPVQDL
jgi:hypothetical protein